MRQEFYTCLGTVAIRLRGIDGLKERQFIDAVKGVSAVLIHFLMRIYILKCIYSNLLEDSNAIKPSF
jgi:hypothetical protein